MPESYLHDRRDFRALSEDIDIRIGPFDGVTVFASSVSCCCNATVMIDS